jgi:hypothetical protein
VKSLAKLIENAATPTRFAQALGLYNREDTAVEHTIHTGRAAEVPPTIDEIGAALDKGAAKLRAAGITRAQMEVVREVITDLLLGELEPAER